MEGGTHNDSLFGDGGDDFVKGNSGTDSIWGGTEADKMWGDAPAGTFDATDTFFDGSSADEDSINGSAV